ncbi:MAG: hypothetical protein JKX85_13080 [Phycisphaeraceae bacterium]|nr:hypothetical protein [Phycisphaeraceae bacterium]
MSDQFTTALPHQSSCNLKLRSRLGWADVIGLLVILLAGILMTWWSWLCWPDPLIDFGRELYTPWQLTQGKVLYRDLMLFNGPLSQYFNAMLFTLFGVGLRTLVVANLLILTATLGLIYIAVRELASPIAATMGCLTVVLLFAFKQYSLIGNFNWICPYSHEITHGISLSILALCLTGRWMALGSGRRAWILGLIVGLVFLTKVEIFVACMGSVTVAWFYPLVFKRRNVRQWLAETSLFFIGLLSPPLIALGLLSMAMPFKLAFTGTIGSWAYVLVKQHTNLPFFTWSIGGSSLSKQLYLTLCMIGWYLLLIGPMVLICLAWARSWRWRIAAGLVMILAVLFILFMQGTSIFESPLTWLKSQKHWGEFAFPWPLIILIIFSILLLGTWRHRRESEVSLLWARGAIYTLFALMMMAKMLFNVRLWQYGFALTMPAAVVIVVVMFEGLPNLLRRYKLNRSLLRLWMLILWGCVLIFHLNVTSSIFHSKNTTVATGVDQFRAYYRGDIVNKILQYLQENAQPTDTIAVMPDGEMIQYLARLTNPSPYSNYIPATLILFGEGKVLKSLQKNPPTWIVLAHRETSEYGAASFGKDYAKTIWHWIEKEYKPVYRCGEPPFNPENKFGIVVAKRRTPLPQKSITQ